MRAVKKLFKGIGILALVLFIGLGILYAYKMIKPHVDARKELDGINSVVRSIDDLGIPDSVELIGLGEATHGNTEFQSLKLEVLKTLIRDNAVKAFGMEMDYGEGVIINDYINGKSDKSIDDVLNAVNFDIYKTEDIKNLIQWMKEYNSSASDKLAFYGFDLQNPDVDLKLIKDFVDENHILEEFDITKSFNRFLDGEITFKSEDMEMVFADLEIIQNELANNRDMYGELYNYDRIITCIDTVFKAKELAKRYSDDPTNSLVEGGKYRDQMMSERIVEILNNEQSRGSNFMITGHNGHVGYAGSFVKTVGAYLKEELGNRYFVIGTDYYRTRVNIQSGDTRKNYRFTSCDILAYQAKKIGAFYIKFSDVDENNELYRYINGPINTGSVGESYSVLNHLLPQTVRLYCEINRLYDGMIFFYETTPLKLLSK